MLPPVPRCSGWASSSLISPGRSSLPRFGGRVGLHIDLFEACLAFTRVAACTLAQSPIRDPLIEGFSHFVTSMTAPIPSGWSESPGGPCTHWKKPPCHGAHTRYGRPAAARWPRLRAQSLPPRSSPADRQQAVLQRFVRLQLGALGAENGAATIEHHGIFGEGQGKVGFLFGQDHRDPAVVADRR